jgi:acylphosphatase
VLISGRVQGVYFREACRREAERHGVGGWVRNLGDGRVEAVFEGTPDSVDQLVRWARHGSRLAVVESVTVEVEQPQGLSRFEVT